MAGIGLKEIRSSFSKDSVLILAPTALLPATWQHQALNQT